MISPREIEDAIRANGWDPEEVDEILWTQKRNSPPKLTIRLRPYINITLNILPVKDDEE